METFIEVLRRLERPRGVGYPKAPLTWRAIWPHYWTEISQEWE